MRAAISTEDLDPASLVEKAQASPGLVGRDLVREVAVDEAFVWDRGGPEGVPHEREPDAPHPTYRVVAFDAGIKYNILRRLTMCGCEVHVVPPTTDAAEVSSMEPDGIFLANGPGDPAAVAYLYGTLRDLIGARPIFGICLGHQMLSLAVGADTFKLKYGHRGGNQPVMNLLSGRVEITSQNHGFCVDFAAIGPHVASDLEDLAHDPGAIAEWVEARQAPVVESSDFGRVQLTHVNLNDMTVEGIRLLDVPAFSVQYHPEAAPGPHDARYLFDAFVRLMEGRSDYLHAADGT
jgi:carbamoyl-phosphate synthase small subunit